MTRALGAVLLFAALGVHALVKLSHGTLGEMLYTCHVATATLALGLLTRRHALVAAGFLFHLGLGFPAWILDAAFASGTIPSSVAVHVLPLLVGGLEVRRRGLPARSFLLAGLLYPVAALLSLGLTDPALNVNLVHAPWGPTRFLGRAGTWLVNGLACLILPLAADRLWRLTLERTPLPLHDRAL